MTFKYFLGKNTDKYESQMNSLGNDEYEAILTIKNLDESDNENNYYLEFTPNDEEPQRYGKVLIILLLIK